jgi:hypothetical protein
VTVSNLRPDTGASNFIYVLEDGITDRSVVSGLTTPLFVPELTSASPSKLSMGLTTEFTLNGDSFYPCGLDVSIFKENANNLIVV